VRDGRRCTGTCWVESLYGVVVDLERGVGVAPSEPDDVVAPIVELDEPVANHVVRQTDVVHDKHAAIHLPTTTRTQLTPPLNSTV